MAQAAATLTPSSPIMAPFRCTASARCRRAARPNLGEHAGEILSEFGFDFKGIEGLRPSGAVSKAKVRAA